MNKKRKLIGIAFLVFILAYWGTVFFMRDKGANWCNLSLGTYDVQGSKKAGGPDSTFGSTFGASYIEIYGCQGGVFGFTDKK